MTALATIWAYVKKYWSLALLVVGGIAAFFVFRQREISFADEYKKIKDAHDEELKRIQDARAEEQRQHEANVKKLQDTLAAVQKHYDEARKDLDAKKKAQIEDLVKKYKDDPDELAKKLSEATGFVIVLPNP
jgi:Skp family chaperone for outer membrane proteins